MTTHEESPITVLLHAMDRGDRKASAELLPLIYDELRRAAQIQMAHENPGQTLQPTALVHEAYLRVAGEDRDDWNSRGHFFGAAALAMRRILVEQARKKRTHKRSRDGERVDLEDVALEIEAPPGDVLAINEAVARLEAADPRKGEIVNFRYFLGMTVAETATAMSISVSLVEKEWRFIRSWLQLELSKDD